MSGASLALYIHWPFCLAKCPYCDFNSHVRTPLPQMRFARALRRELATEAQRLNAQTDPRTGLRARRRLTSIFFGGGTPSLMAPETVAALIEEACRLFTPAENLEITLEANPTSVEAGRFQAFRQAGINRVSLGIQSLRDEALKALGRQHTARQAISALELARKLFPRISFDLIYARPGQTVADWQQELRQGLALAADHLSLYQLTIEPGTVFESRYRQGQLVLPPDEQAAEMYTLTAQEAARHGLEAYEVSNYALPGSESRHNLAYWRYDDYLGIGPGAHGRLTLNNTLLASRRHRAPEAWADLVERDGTGLRQEMPLSTQERAREALLMGLRLKAGLDLAHFRQRTGQPLDESVDHTILEACLAENYLQRTPSVLKATAEGRLRLEALLSRLVL
ncbi:radical SAM family heme chaperone HemW [Oecophyllibacter saccharovorans]|uniref:Heme chaperone HemW n=1 Tax=Oecophyllibacter saccharovorans TaxID=2558360 RepID=A0A506ULS5_9PROT|nr:radical SAM family heme chaperone HemW [Oecophyllibacter saccharovorans]TPW34301.1 coproporphyrinogen III oxidase [Oecophyllibacter saccharovorans]